MIGLLGELIQPEYGWILVLAYLFYEIHYGQVEEHLGSMDDKLTSAIIVIRALVKTNGDVSTSKVDDMLPDGCTGPSDLIEDVAADGGEIEIEENDDDD